MLVTLGIDIGNSKVKFCALKLKNKELTAIWESYSLPYTHNRRLDFEIGFYQRLEDFLNKKLLMKKTDIDLAICCSSNSYSFTTFDLGVLHTAQILKDNFSNNIKIISANGELYSPDEVLSMYGINLYRFALTNFYGSAYLGSKLIKNGISIDIGTTTTDIIPIKDGEIDPDNLKYPDNYIEHRYSSKKINWYGMTITPLCFLTDSIPLNGKKYSIVPRDYYTDLVISVLELMDIKLIQRHAYFDYFPNNNTSASKIAQFIGLDDKLLSYKDIKKIAQYLYKRLIDKIVSSIRYVIKTEFKDYKLNEIEIASFALGQDVLTKPAIIKAGLNENNIKTLQDKRNNLWTVTSAYALALKAFEILN